MSSPQSLSWLQPQQRRLDEFDVAHCVDIHCHILPGLDDGPRDLPQAVSLCAALAADGITTAIATPHQLGRYDRLNSAAAIQEKIEQLQAALAAEQIPLNILPGGDVRIDEQIGKLMQGGEIITLAAAGKHLLLELPHEFLVDPLPTIDMLCGRDLQPILTHPERHPYLANQHALLRTWLARGAVIQVTAGSLLGEFGRRAYDQAWKLLHDGLVALVATDAHDVLRRPPRLTEAIDRLTRELDHSPARALCIDNPLRVLRGEIVAAPQPTR